MNREIIKHLREQVEQKVTGLFDKYTPSFLIYHNITHTKSVVDHAMEIATHYTLNDEDLFILFTAAWFHDTGQLFSVAAWHEEESIKLANTFLQENPDIPYHVITAIDLCILSTKIPQSPYTLTEQILCDADLYHFGTDSFRNINENVKKEAELRGMNIEHWDEGTLKMLQEHQFHTDFCREALADGKAKNMAQLQRSLNTPEG